MLNKENSKEIEKIKKQVLLSLWLEPIKLLLYSRTRLIAIITQLGVIAYLTERSQSLSIWNWVTVIVCVAYPVLFCKLHGTRLVNKLINYRKVTNNQWLFLIKMQKELNSEKITWALVSENKGSHFLPHTGEINLSLAWFNLYESGYISYKTLLKLIGFVVNHEKAHGEFIRMDTDGKTDWYNWAIAINKSIIKNINHVYSLYDIKKMAIEGFCDMRACKEVNISRSRSYVLTLATVLLIERQYNDFTSIHFSKIKENFFTFNSGLRGVLLRLRLNTAKSGIEKNKQYLKL